MASEPDLALYVGSIGSVLWDGTVLEPGETICVVPRGEAEASDHWEPIDKLPKGKTVASQNVAQSDSEATAAAAAAVQAGET